jgi:hypothetical protein
VLLRRGNSENTNGKLLPVTTFSEPGSSVSTVDYAAD